VIKFFFVKQGPVFHRFWKPCSFQSFLQLPCWACRSTATKKDFHCFQVYFS